MRSHVETDERVIALTLDDGYHADGRILDLIDTYHLHGTAFVVGQVADADPDYLRELVRRGWVVCSHTYSHRRLTSLDVSQMRREIERGAEAVASVVGYRCPYFRAPFGSVDDRVLGVTDSMGLQLIGWESSISDTAPPGTDPNRQIAIAKSYLRPGSILLGHFGGTNSYTVLQAVISWLLESGYRIGNVSELLAGTVPSPEPIETPAPAPAAQPSEKVFEERVSTRDVITGRVQIVLEFAGLLLVFLLASSRLLRRRGPLLRGVPSEAEILRWRAVAAYHLVPSPQAIEPERSEPTSDQLPDKKRGSEVELAPS